MMEFNEFTDRITGLVQQKMGEGYTVTATKVLKNNDITRTGIVIMEKKDSMSPTIYLEEPYQQYQDGVDVEEIVEEITVLYEQHSHNIKLDMDFFGDFSQVEDRIFHILSIRSSTMKKTGSCLKVCPISDGMTWLLSFIMQCRKKCLAGHPSRSTTVIWICGKRQRRKYTIQPGGI